ncbi:MAG: chloride channel protein [bacterium]
MLELPRTARPLDGRVLGISALAISLALVATGVARALSWLIATVTNVAYFGRWSSEAVAPGANHLGWLAVCVPVAGGLIVGWMARWGSPAIRGHGIPEAMEQVLTNASRIQPRLTWLKPLSAAISIGTGGPFGAEGPIIATGGALGSVLGQVLRTSAAERKTLLAAGAAAGMTATFGSPISAVLLAIELLLFELKPRSIIPVALAAATAAAARWAMLGPAPMFAMEPTDAIGLASLAVYTGIGALVGLAAVGATRLVYAIEDGFEKLPIHWMWWPALGGVVVGLVGLVAPRTLGVGYDNIDAVLGGELAGGALAVLAIAKLVSWSIALGSGTSGGTLAPLFTIGGALGAALASALLALWPHAAVNPRVAALVGMAAMFAGSSRALLASVVFSFETTRQPMGLVPLLAGATAALLVSWLLMRNSIMTEKMARRGVRASGEYTSDPLASIEVAQVASRAVSTVPADRPIAELRRWMDSGEPGSAHQGFPIVDEHGALVGVVTRKDLIRVDVPHARRAGEIAREPVLVAFEDSTLAEALTTMVRADVGRLPVVDRRDPHRVTGFLTRSDILAAYRRSMAEERRPSRRARGRRACKRHAADATASHA